MNSCNDEHHSTGSDELTLQFVRAIIFLARQGLPLQGHIASIHNPGNFLALLKST